MASWNEANALCPFYDTDEKKAVICEAMLPGTKKIKHLFKSETDKNEHMSKCCNKHYFKCLYYQSLIKSKY